MKITRLAFVTLILIAIEIFLELFKDVIVENLPFQIPKDVDISLLITILIILCFLLIIVEYLQEKLAHPPHQDIKPVVAIHYPNSAKAKLTFKNIVENPDSFQNCIIEPYVLQEFIGSGGSGLVYRAYNHRLGQEFVVKIFYPFKSELENIVKVFARAVRGLTNFNHPYIVKTYDFGRLKLNNNISFYIVMEMVNGQALDAWNENLSNNKNKLSERIKIALKIATGLREAHNCKYVDEVGFEQTGILHGDIKPENILVRPDNSPALIDFMMVDIQRLVDPDVTGIHPIDKRTCTQAFGTPEFMAPEQEEKGIVTIKTDIYSLGVTFIYLFLPNFPFAIIDQEVIAEYGKDTNSRLYSLKKLLTEMQNKNPEKRPLNMEVVINRLENIALEMGINI